MGWHGIALVSGLRMLPALVRARPPGCLSLFFSAFFSLSNERWFGFLANTLPTPELLNTMLQLFGGSSNPVRWGLMQPRGRELSLMAKMLQW